MSLFDLTGRCVVVTGARGFLGRPICAALVEAGARIIGLDLITDDRDSASWYCDVESIESVETVGRACPTPDGLLCLAGIDAKPGTNDADPWRDFGEMLVANLAGTANACRVFGQSMADAGRGSIVTVGSMYAHCSPDDRMYRGDDQYLVERIDPDTDVATLRRVGDATPAFTKPIGYTASKHAVLGLTRHLAAQWASAGVRVNCLSPGGIGSDGTPADFRERFSGRVPLGRMGTPGDLVGAIIWLLSDASAYVTGQEIKVDGGVGLWP